MRLLLTIITASVLFLLDRPRLISAGFDFGEGCDGGNGSFNVTLSQKNQKIYIGTIVGSPLTATRLFEICSHKPSKTAIWKVECENTSHGK